DALKVAFPLALVGASVGEFIGGDGGIGQLVLAAQFNLDTPLVFASLVSITVFTTAGIGLISCSSAACSSGGRSNAHADTPASRATRLADVANR
ncbi:MAG TPA: ABC transporter permease subunit, partial [Casimicrobiaceae bacterium]|nr:ABC transporter permease subunit [Casimicrobiaceae bacterium]